MKWIYKTALIAAMSVLCFGSCQNKGPAAYQDPLEEKYKLIDRGEYTEAINQLTELAATDQRPQVKVTLASAYAGRAGIRVENYWGFVIGFKTPLVKPEDVAISPAITGLQNIARQVKGDLKPAEAEDLGKVVRILSLWDQYKERIKSVPVVTGDALADLQKAVEVLDQVQTPGGRLYRAILDLILFKSYIAASNDFWDRFNQVIEKVLGGDIKLLCQFDFDVLEEWLDPISTYLMQTLSDLQIAFPQQTKELGDAHDFVNLATQATLKAVDELKRKRLCP